MERLQRLEAAPAGDEAVGQGALPALGDQGRHLHGGALAVEADRCAQGAHLGVLDGEAVAGQVVGGDGFEGEVEDHAAGVAGVGDAVGKVPERGGAGGLGGDAGDRRRGTQGGGTQGCRAEGEGRGEGHGEGMFRARNIESFSGNEGQAAAGHQAVSFLSSGSEVAAAPDAASSSSRRQAASRSFLKAA